VVHKLDHVAKPTWIEDKIYHKCLIFLAWNDSIQFAHFDTLKVQFELEIKNLEYFIKIY